MAIQERLTLRNLYLYLVCLVTLVMSIFATVNLVRSTVELLGVDESRAGGRELVQATLDLVRGLGLASTITDDAARRTRILDHWADILDGREDPRTSRVDGRRAGA